MFAPAGTALTRDQRLGGSGWFGTVGIGYDMQFSPKWVAGVFGDVQFGDVRGSFADSTIFEVEGPAKLRTGYAAGVRLGYLVAPNVLSYVNAGYSGSEWSATSMTVLQTPFVAGTQMTAPSFRRDGWFIGGGVENNLDIFGISAPGWFMKTEYRSAFYDRVSLPTSVVPGNVFAATPGLSGEAITFKPWVQTISTSLVYRFNSGGSPAMAALPYSKAPAPVAAYNWTGFSVFGGGGGGLWNADSNVVSTGLELSRLVPPARR